MHEITTEENAKKKKLNYLRTYKLQQISLRLKESRAGINVES